MAAEFILKNLEIKPMTRELAEQMRNMAPSPTERIFDPKRVDMLREKVISGRVLPFYWGIVEVDGKRYRMNGQHSSLMLCELPDPFPEGLKAVLSEFKAPTMLDSAVLFRQFDERRSARSALDVSGAYQGLHPELGNVPRKIGKLSIESVVWLRTNVMGVPCPYGDDKYQLFNETGLHSFLQWIGEVLSERKTRETNYRSSRASGTGGDRSISGPLRLLPDLPSTSPESTSRVSRAGCFRIAE